MRKFRKPPLTSRRGFSLIELLVVIAVIGVLTSIISGVSGTARKSSRIKRIEGQLAELQTLIDDYKSEMGFFPPDTQVMSGGVVQMAPNGKPQVDAVFNPLFYELTGTLVDIDNGLYRSVALPADTAIDGQTTELYFNREGFNNTGRTEAELRYSYVGFSEKQYEEISPRDRSVHLLEVPMPWPAKFEDSNPNGSGAVNTWRYNSSNPTKNPASYDLWAEIVDGTDEDGDPIIRRIGNWAGSQEE